MASSLTRKTNVEIAALLDKANVIKVGHFVGTSGKHLDRYVDKDTLGRNPHLLDQLAYELAFRIGQRLHLGGKDNDVVAVIGAPMGAIALSSRVCYWLNDIFLSSGTELHSLYAEKGGAGPDAPFKIRPSFAALIKGKRVISIEDILNTGLSGKKMVAALEACGAVSACCGAICNRGGVLPEFLGVPSIVSLMDVVMTAYDLNIGTCPLCADGIQINTVLGHGAAYVAEHGQPSGLK